MFEAKTAPGLSNALGNFGELRIMVRGFFSLYSVIANL